MVPAKVQTVLDRHGLKALEFEPGSTPTSEMAAQKIGVEVGQIAKSILVKGKNQVFYLIVCCGDKRISNQKLKSVLGVKARMATHEETETVTGFKPGGVCPFGLSGIDIFIDRALSQYDLIYPAAGTDASGVPMTFTQLCTITGGQPDDICEDFEKS